jgi:hypothetical protein
LGIKPHWVLFRKFFRVKPQPSANNPRVIGGADILCPSTPSRVHPMRSVAILNSSTGYVVVLVLIQCASCRMT